MPEIFGPNGGHSMIEGFHCNGDCKHMGVPVHDITYSNELCVLNIENVGVNNEPVYKDQEFSIMHPYLVWKHIS